MKFRHPIVNGFLRHLAAFATITLTTLILRPLEARLTLQVIALLYLLPVMVSTVLGGLTPGILAGALAFLAFNYYFIEPHYTLRVHATQDLITLIIFLVVAVVMSQLIGQAREGVRLARIREWEATRMYRLISALAGLQDASSIAQTLAIQVFETFQVDFVELKIDKGDLEAALLVHQPGIPTPSTSPTHCFKLATARSQEGELRLWHPSTLAPESERLLQAFVGQGALALERVRLAQNENKTRVLEESDRLKTALLNSVSHELRSPLAAIKASVSSLRDGTVDWNDFAREDLLATIEEETDHLNLLVGNLLDMSRIEAGALQPRRRWNTLGEIVRGVLVKMHNQLQNHQVEVALEDDLPLVPTDYIMMEQVFTNLLSNSAKYAPPGTSIQISAAQEGALLHVQVRNHSPRVPEEHLDHIFEKFYRVTEADRVTGTGLGLSICKGLIEAHGGNIWAQNCADGLIFHFTLPLTLDGALPELPKEASDG